MPPAEPGNFASALTTTGAGTGESKLMSLSSSAGAGAATDEGATLHGVATAAGAAAAAAFTACMPAEEMPSMARLTLGDGGIRSGTGSTASWLASTGDAASTAWSGERAGGGMAGEGGATYPYADKLASVLSSMERLSACIAWSARLVAASRLVVGPTLLTSLSCFRRACTGRSSAVREPLAGAVRSVVPLSSTSQSSSSCWQCDASRAKRVASIGGSNFQVHDESVRSLAVHCVSPPDAPLRRDWVC